MAEQQEKIRAAVRFRPPTEDERKEPGEWGVDPSRPDVVSARSARKRARRRRGAAAAVPGTVSHSERTMDKEYTGFTSIFGPDASTADVYEQLVRDMVASCLDGFNGTVLAYGYTGTGKTFTMTGDPEQQGITLMAVKQILGVIDRSEGRKITLHLQYVEVYEEKVRDLLHGLPDELLAEDGAGAMPDTIAEEAPASGGLGAPGDDDDEDDDDEDDDDAAAAAARHKAGYGPHNLQVAREDGELYNASLVEINSVERAYVIMMAAARNRVTSDNGKNDLSSRSHAIMRLVVVSDLPEKQQCDRRHPRRGSRGRNGKVIRVLKSYLNLVDLAGVENFKDTGGDANSETGKESRNINASLHQLQNVVLALGKSNVTETQRFAALRNNGKLPHLLMNSLGGNSKTLFIGTGSTSRRDAAQTKTMLDFMLNIMKVSNRPKKNEVSLKGREVIKFLETAGDQRRRVSQGGGFGLGGGGAAALASAAREEEHVAQLERLNDIKHRRKVREHVARLERQHEQLYRRAVPRPVRRNSYPFKTADARALERDMARAAAEVERENAGDDDASSSASVSTAASRRESVGSTVSLRLVQTTSQQRQEIDTLQDRVAELGDEVRRADDEAREERRRAEAAEARARAGHECAAEAEERAATVRVQLCRMRGEGLDELSADELAALRATIAAATEAAARETYRREFLPLVAEGATRDAPAAAAGGLRERLDEHERLRAEAERARADAAEAQEARDRAAAEAREQQALLAAERERAEAAEAEAGAAAAAREELERAREEAAAELERLRAELAVTRQERDTNARVNSHLRRLHESSGSGDSAFSGAAAAAPASSPAPLSRTQPLRRSSTAAISPEQRDPPASASRAQRRSTTRGRRERSEEERLKRRPSGSDASRLDLGDDADDRSENDGAGNDGASSAAGSSADSAFSRLMFGPPN